MRAVLVIACISVFGIVSARPPHTVPEKLADIFGIRVEQAEFCVEETKVTRDDLRALEDQLNETYNEKLLEQDNTRRAIGTLTCAAQAQGTMLGAKLQMPRIHELLDGVSEMPQTTKRRMHDILDTCYVGVKDLNDRYEVGLRFITCLIIKSPRK